MMFRHLFALMIVGTLLLSGGCKEETPPTTPPPTPPVTPPEVEDDATDTSDATSEAPDQTPVTGEEVMRETGEAVDAAVSFADQEKDQFIATSEEKLEALRARWSSWQAEAGETTEQMKQKLSEQYKEANEKLARLKDSSGEAWSQMKAGFLDAYEDLETATKEAAQKFDDPDANTN